MLYQDDEHIRIPDKTNTEQLLEDDRSQYQKDIDAVLFLSMKEMDNYNTNYSNYEQLIVEEYTNETKKRHSLFAPILFEINKISKFDKDIKDLYQIIKPIIDSYCNICIEYYEFDELTYNFIFKQIGSIRISKFYMTFLETIFVKKEVKLSNI